MNTKHLPWGLTSAPVILLALLLGTPARASQIQGVTINALSSQYTSLNTSTPDRRYATNLVTSTGLFGDIGTYTPQGAEWLSAAAPPTVQFVTFDLGSVQQVDAMKVWNFNQNGSSANLNNCVRGAFIAYSTDGVNFTTNYLGAQLFTQAPGTFTAFAQTITTNMGFSARYVRLNILSNYTATGITGTVGLSKVRFIENSLPLAVLSATENYSSNQITVKFAESVDPVTATTLANYSIRTNGAIRPGTLLSAAMGEFNDQVILQTTPLTNSNYSVSVTGVYDQALTTPTAGATVPVQPELILWLKADAGVLTDLSGNVTNWLDQSIYGHDAGPATVNQYSAPPTLLAGAVNGLPALSFNGTQLMQVTNDANLAVNGDVTVCLVLDKTTTAGGDPISKTGGQGNPYTGTPQHGYTNNMPAPFDYQITSAQKSSWTWGNGAGGAPPTLVSSGAFVTGQYYIVLATMHGTNGSWYLNGSFNGSGILGVAPADQGTPIMLGVRSDSGNVGDNGLTFAGNIAEVMVLRGTLTPADLVSINQYLGQKYNIPIQSLSITEQPQSVTAEVGKTATFWVNAVGVPPLTYQWKTNNVNITGATSATYTTPPLALAANGESFTVTVTTPVGATNSAPAPLFVVNDTTPPTVFSATKTAGTTNIVVSFSESVASPSALTAANYSLNNGASVLSAIYGSATSNSVILTTATLDPNASYYLTVQNVQDLFGNAMTSATVPVLPANLSVFLRGDSGVALDTTNSLVYRWLDQTTNGNNAVQFAGGPAARPTPTLDINSEPTLAFNAFSGNYLQAASSPTLAIVGDMSIVAVANFSDYSAPREILGKTLLNQPASYDYYVSSPTDFRFYRGNGAAGSVVGRATAAPSTGVPHVISVTMAGTNVAHFLDGQANGTAIVAATLGDSGTPLRIGSRDDLSQFMNGDLAELMVFSSAISTNDRVAIDDYLGLKYFPFAISQPPADVTTTEGVTATFSVVASQGSAHLTYQWQEDSTNLPGATATSYTTPILAPSDNGETFDVVITIPGLSTNTSPTATLTVNNVAPTITSAGIPIWSRTNIVVFFFEAVDPATATTSNNYLLDNGATVLSAAIGDAPNKVVLTTSVLTPFTAYNLTVQNVKDLFNNPIVTVTVPLGVYPPATALWLRADAGVTADPTTGLVSGWDDQSGNANNLVAGVQPLVVSNALNTLPVIRFDGASTYMYAGSSPTLAITGDLSIFAVVNFSNLTSSGSQGTIVSKTVVNQPAPYDYYARSTGLQFYRGNGTVNGLSQATVVPSIQHPHILDVVMAGTTVTHRLDGNANGSGAISTTIADQGHALFIGTREDNVNHLYGDLAELVVVGAGVSSNDVASLESYLASKYFFPIGSQAYPVITREPVASTNVDQNSTLMVAAAATGNPAVAYQWFDTNNVPVPGQTNATLVISNIQTSGSYYLTVTNIFGSATSSVVAVNVFSGAPQVSLGPPSLSLYAGGNFTYNVLAYGSAPLYYHWYQDGGTIPGATNSSYTLAVALGTNTFSCTVSNSVSAVPSSAVTLIGVSAPTGFYAATVLSNNPVAYWRLDEPNGSSVAMDYVGGHSCLYSNVQLGVPGYPSFAPDTAAEFGILLASNSYAGEIDDSTSGVPNIDFSQPAGGNAELSVEAWVNSSASQIAGAGIVTKGYGNGGEQFDLDMGAPLGFRFFVRDASGGVHSANSSVVPTIGQWYHLVGVWDGANGAVRLYINGADNTDVTNIATGIGLQTSTTSNTNLPGAALVSIGARASTLAVTNYDLQFMGTVDEVAIYDYALSPSQVAAQYQAAITPPRETITINDLGGGQLQLNWSFGTLQSSTNVTGPYSDITNAAPPYPVSATNAHQFYRIREN